MEKVERENEVFVKAFFCKVFLCKYLLFFLLLEGQICSVFNVIGGRHPCRRFLANLGHSPLHEYPRHKMPIRKMKPGRNEN